MWAHRGFLLSVILTSLVAFDTSALAGINSWTSTGPGGGVVYAIQALPDEVVLASVTCTHSGACSQGGVFRSTDGGQSWIRSDTGLHSDRVIQLAVDPADSDIFYAVGAATLFRSVNGGFDWSFAGEGLDQNWLNSISFRPGSAGVLYAATSGGIYRSEDFAESWQLVNGLNSQVLAMDPNDPQIMYAARDAVYKSTDGGLTWQPLSVIESGSLDVYSMLVDPNDSDRVYLVSVAPDQGLYVSTDAGETWDPVDVPVYHETRASLLTAAPGSPTVLYLTTPSGVMRSTDGAQSWLPFSTDLPDAPASVAVAPDSPETLYAGTYEAGVFRMDNGPAGWHATGDLAHLSMVSALVVDPAHAGVGYAATAATGVYKTNDSGAHWQPAREGLQDSAISTVALDPSDALTLFAGGQSLYKSTDGGQSWQAESEGIPGGATVASVLVDPAEPSRVFAGTDVGLYRSIDSGLRWTLASDDLPTTTWFTTLTAAPSGSIFVAAGPDLTQSPPSFLAYSTDGGDTWTRLDLAVEGAEGEPSMPVQYILQIAFAPDRPVGYAATEKGLFKSTDGGATWTYFEGGWGQRAVFRMAVGRDGVLWVTDGTHVSRSTDEGVSFLPFNEGLPPYGGVSIALDQTAGVVYVGSQYDGAYTLNPQDVSFVPFVPGNGLQGGFAVVNPQPSEALPSLSLYDGAGEALGTGPSLLVGPAGQLARTLPEAAGGTLPDGAAWGELDGLTSVPSLVSVFDRSLRALDAAALPASTREDVVFPDLTLADISKFYLTNPNKQDAEAEVQLISSDGIPRTETVHRTIGVRQTDAETLASFFPGTSIAAGDYLRVHSIPGIVAVQLFDDPGRAAAILPGISTAGVTRNLCAPQFTVGYPQMDSVIFVVNLSKGAASVRVSVHLPGEDPYSAPLWSTIVEGNGSLVIDGSELFPEGVSEPSTGFVTIEAIGALLAGTIHYRAKDGSFLSALPLVAQPPMPQPPADLVLPHLVSDAQYFTGIAIANARVNQWPVTGTIELYSSAGELIATREFELGSYERSSLLLTEYFPELVGQSIGSGYVRIRADHPVACVALYGASDLSTFSVIPVWSAAD